VTRDPGRGGGLTKGKKVLREGGAPVQKIRPENQDRKKKAVFLAHVLAARPTIDEKNCRTQHVRRILQQGSSLAGTTADLLTWNGS